jgi:hypothetical protein
MSQSKEAATSEFGAKLTSRNVRYSLDYEAEADMQNIAADVRWYPTADVTEENFGANC